MQAIAALLWPLFAFTFLIMFRREIGAALSQIRRIKKGKIFGHGADGTALRLQLIGYGRSRGLPLELPISSRSQP